MNTAMTILAIWILASLPAAIITGKCLKRLSEVESRERLRDRGLL